MAFHFHLHSTLITASLPLLHVTTPYHKDHSIFHEINKILVLENPPSSIWIQPQRKIPIKCIVCKSVMC